MPLYSKTSLFNTVLATLFISSTLFGSSNPIKLGLTTPLSGSNKSIGTDYYTGASTYFKHLNSQGGIKGQLVEFKAYDNQYDPKTALVKTVQLIETDKIDALFGNVGTPTTIRILPLIKHYESTKPLMLFFPLTGALPVRKGPYSSNVLNLRASYDDETEGLVDHFFKLNRKRIAIFYQSDSFGRSGWSGIAKALKKRGLYLVKETTYKRGTSFNESYSKQVSILKAANPDAIIIVGTYEPSAGFIRDARNAGLQVPIANISFVGSEALLNQLSRLEQKTQKDYTQNLINSQVVPYYLNTQLPAVNDYLKLLKTYYPHEKPSFVSFEGFLAAKLWTHLFATLGSPLSPQKIQSYLNTSPKIDLGIELPVHFNSQSNQGLHTVFYVGINDKNKFVPLQEKDWLQWKK